MIHGLRLDNVVLQTGQACRTSLALPHQRACQQRNKLLLKKILINLILLRHLRCAMFTQNRGWLRPDAKKISGSRLSSKPPAMTSRHGLMNKQPRQAVTEDGRRAAPVRNKFAPEKGTYYVQGSSGTRLTPWALTVHPRNGIGHDRGPPSTTLLDGALHSLRRHDPAGFHQRLHLSEF
ncbi:hypothetical protein DESC_740076 [Desulfosarcina cetonica]|nr:hypothetical protein DESC_740076 [Desulfosarcina cetonica]